MGPKSNYCEGWWLLNKWGWWAWMWKWWANKWRRWHITLGASPCEVVGAWIEWNYRTTGNLIIKATLMTSIIANCHAVTIPKPNTQRKILQHLTFPLVKSFSASQDCWLWPCFLFLLFLTTTPPLSTASKKMDRKFFHLLFLFDWKRILHSLFDW